MKRLDLTNLGYVNFYEVVTHYFDQLKHYYFLEESFYEYSLYEILDKRIKKTQKISKAPNFADTIKELKKNMVIELKLISWLEKEWQHQELETKYRMVEGHLVDAFTKIYFKDQQVPSVDPEVAGLTLAPGFSRQEVNQQTLPLVTDTLTNTQVTTDFKLPAQFSRIKFALPKIDWHQLISRIPQKVFLFIIPLILGLGFLGYLLILHQAVIILKTKKENFSSNVEFLVSDKSDFIRTFQAPVSLTVSEATSGERVTGEKAKGEVIIYNGLFEKKELPTGFIFKTSNGLAFALEQAVSVPAASTSADLDEGLITTAFGKKPAAVIASTIGAEGNLDSGIKLTTQDYPAKDFYALTNAEFKGGVKKTVAVFADKDALSLEKKAVTTARNKLTNEFSKIHNQDILFPETISTTGIKKEFSEKLGTETNRIDLKYRGQVRVFYAPYKQLVKKVQNQKLEGKEFVEQTFTLDRVKLLNKKNNIYTYTATITGQVQNLLDQNSLRQRLAGKFSGSAKKLLEQQPSITNFLIKTEPIPLPILPWRLQAIKFKFEL